MAYSDEPSARRRRGRPPHGRGVPLCHPNSPPDRPSQGPFPRERAKSTASGSSTAIPRAWTKWFDDPHLLKRGNAFTFRAKVPSNSLRRSGASARFGRACAPPILPKRSAVRDRTNAFERQCQRFRERIDGEVIGTIELTCLSETEIKTMVRNWFAQHDQKQGHYFTQP